MPCFHGDGGLFIFGRNQKLSAVPALVAGTHLALRQGMK